MRNIFKKFIFLFADLLYTYKLTHVIIKIYRRKILMEQNELNLQIVDDNENPFAINNESIFGTHSLFAAKKKKKDEEDDDSEDEDDYYNEEEEDDLLDEEPEDDEDIFDDDFDIDDDEDLLDDDEEEDPFI